VTILNQYLYEANSKASLTGFVPVAAQKGAGSADEWAFQRNRVKWVLMQTSVVSLSCSISTLSEIPRLVIYLDRSPLRARVTKKLPVRHALHVVNTLDAKRPDFNVVTAYAR